MRGSVLVLAAWALACTGSAEQDEIDQLRADVDASGAAGIRRAGPSIG